MKKTISSFPLMNIRTPSLHYYYAFSLDVFPEIFKSTAPCSGKSRLLKATNGTEMYHNGSLERVAVDVVGTCHNFPLHFSPEIPVVPHKIISNSSHYGRIISMPNAWREIKIFPS
jgi:hypothetical protein